MASEYLGLDHYNLQAFGRCVDRSRKPGGSRSDDSDVNRGGHRFGCVHSQRFDEFDRGGLHEDPSVVEDCDRQGTGRASVLKQSSTFR